MLKTVNIDCNFDPRVEMSLFRFIECLNDILESVPEEYQDSVEIEVRAVNDYDYYVPEWTISYRRPETPEEELYRLSQEKVYAEQQKANARRMLEQAKKILGGD